MTDHDAIAARVRDHIARGGSPYIAPSEYLDLYDEVQRLRADKRLIIDERDNTFALMLARAEKAEAERDALQSQCCMCGKTGLSTIEDGGPECELDDGRWVCSVDCYDLAVLNHLVAEAERDRLRAALNEIATAASGIAHGLQIGPDDEGRDIHEMALAIRDDARAALKGDSDE